MTILQRADRRPSKLFIIHSETSTDFYRTFIVINVTRFTQNIDFSLISVVTPLLHVRFLYVIKGLTYFAVWTSGIAVRKICYSASLLPVVTHKNQFIRLIGWSSENNDVGTIRRHLCLEAITIHDRLRLIDSPVRVINKPLAP